ncbi:MAG: bifunctional DNA-formamidopyrimidine glycosylase/DNA-(apurinic or apyrimidinic site) lyase [Planctomycetota bacterium]|jgi:formamidopyrimidine-DNA glycosylase|nr:bifunctional DNA-formamidopyrimidine glycosylase/DNA-(apurinic or apyrimidinic site) lyase [Planctomycetota bacterium]
MPELPEVEAIRRQIGCVVTGGLICMAKVQRRDVVRDRLGRREGRLSPDDLGRRRVIRDVDRRGKQLMISFSDGGGMIIRLGMSGRINLEDGSTRQSVFAHRHLVWMIESPNAPETKIRMSFIDPRRFGGVYLFTSAEDCQSRLLAGLGPEATSIQGRRLGGLLRRTRRAVKAALLDQAVLAGVGNIYADEALHRAGLHPARPGDSISSPEASRLAAAIRFTLRRAIQAGGSTLRDHVLPDGSAGVFVGQHQVYGRGGAPCLHCRHPLEVVQIASRTTTFCPKCQR